MKSMSADNFYNLRTFPPFFFFTVLMLSLLIVKLPMKKNLAKNKIKTSLLPNVNCNLIIHKIKN